TTTWHPHHYTHHHNQPHTHTHLDLPTYPFQHHHYWLESTQPGAGNVSAAGLDPTEHPLLGATLELAEGDGCLLTGRLSLRTHPWLAGHAVGGVVLLPGTAFAELALHAGESVGCDHVDELTLHTPLVIPEVGDVTLQVAIAAPDESGRRMMTIHSRGEGGSGGADASASAWTRHAAGVLSPAKDDDTASYELLAGPWPPVGATPVDLNTAYDQMADAGFAYGLAFQGLRAAWRYGDDILVEARLPEEVSGDAAAYGLHPALLDAALQGTGLLSVAGPGTPVVPHVWNGLRFRTHGAVSVRACLSTLGATGAAVCVRITDDTGVPVASVDRLELRPVDMGQLRAVSVSAGRRGSLYAVQWAEVGPVPVCGQAWAWHEDVGESGGGPVPGVVVLRCPDAGADGGGGGGVGEVVGGVLGVVQGWLGLERFAGSRLVVVTRGAVVAGPEDGPVDVVGAAVWGLVRSAQAEHPDRFVLLDLDTDLDSGADADAGNEAGMGSGLDGGRVAAVVACGEPQLAVRGERVLAARLTRLESPVDVSGREVLPWLSGGSVLVTGGTGVLGAAVARHLAGVCGVRDLLLVSRRGPDAPGAEGLRAELAALGAEVRIVACDVGERREVVRLLEGV
ncbi:polyketide synthase dehydratase domain-containing protein, partial [Streptomyces avermitilis]